MSDSAAQHQQQQQAATVREALELILRPTTNTAEKIVRCGELQERLHRDIVDLTEALHKVSVSCADRAGRIPAALDAHVNWVKQARLRANNVRRSLESTKTRLEAVLKTLQRQADAEENATVRAETQMKSIAAALRASGHAPPPAIQKPPAPAAAAAVAAAAAAPAPEKQAPAEEEKRKDAVAGEQQPQPVAAAESADAAAGEAEQEAAPEPAAAAAEEQAQEE